MLQAVMDLSEGACALLHAARHVAPARLIGKLAGSLSSLLSPQRALLRVFLLGRDPVFS